jgi:hypothetical protein
MPRANPPSRKTAKPPVKAPATPLQAASRDLEIILSFGQRLNLLLDKAGYPTAVKARYTRLAKEYDVSTQTTRKWLHGRGLPNPQILIRLAHDHRVTIDWLLTDASDGTPPDLIPIPLYRLSDTPAPSVPGQFDLVSMYFRRREDYHRLEHEHRAMIINWSDAEDPPILVGDVFLIDTTITTLRENGVYLVRTKALTSIRRIRINLEGQAILSLVSANGDREESIIPITSVTFNPSFDINVPPTTGYTVVGRVIGIQRMLSRRLREF